MWLEACTGKELKSDGQLCVPENIRFYSSTSCIAALYKYNFFCICDCLMLFLKSVLRAALFTGEIALEKICKTAFGQVAFSAFESNRLVLNFVSYLSYDFMYFTLQSASFDLEKWFFTSLACLQS